MSRPRKADRRHHQINLRLSAPEYVRVHAHAALAGKTVPDFARAVLLRRPRRRRRGDDPIIISLSDTTLARWHVLGTQLNDIAHIMNGRDEVPPTALLPLLEQLHRLLQSCFADILSAGVSPKLYTLAPPVRQHVRKVGVNLAQIRRRFEQLGLQPANTLMHLLERTRAVINGDRPPYAA